MALSSIESWSIDEAREEIWACYHPNEDKRNDDNKPDNEMFLEIYRNISLWICIKVVDNDLLAKAFMWAIVNHMPHRVISIYVVNITRITHV